MKSLSSKKGFTNGYKEINSSLPKNKISKIKIISILFIFSFILISFNALVSAETDYIKIDGEFSDWKFNENLGGWYEYKDKIKHYYSFLTPTNGNEKYNKMDSFRLWIDSDNNPNTGLLIRNIGADLRIILDFWKGKTISASLCSWQNGESWQFTEFNGCGGIVANSNVGRTEFYIFNWLLKSKHSWVSESIPYLGERKFISHIDNSFWIERHNSFVWRDFVQADGKPTEWNWLISQNLTQSFTFNNTMFGRLQINSLISRLTYWNTSLLLDLRIDPVNIPFKHSSPPIPNPSKNSEPNYTAKNLKQIPDGRDKLTIWSGDNSTVIYIWQGRIMNMDGYVYGGGSNQMEIQILKSWVGIGITLSPSNDRNFAENNIEPQDSVYAPITILSPPKPPTPLDISGNKVYYFRNTADSTETDCTGVNDRQALLIQGPSFVNTQLTTGQNACWYLIGTLGLIIPAGNWETLLDIQTTGDSGAGNSIGVVAYKSSSGSCGGTAINCPKISYWNGGGSWSSEYELPTAGGSPENIRVLWSPLLTYEHWIVVNSAATITVYYCPDFIILSPSCSSLGTATTQTVGSAPERHWDVAIEQSSGEGLLFYDNPNAVGNDFCYRTFTTTLSSEFCVNHSWVNSTNPSFEYVQLQSNPGVNNIAVFAADTTNDDAILWIWNGVAFLPGDDERACTLAYTLTKSYPGVIVAEDSANEFTAFCGDGASNMNVCEYSSANGWEYDNGGTITCAVFDPNPSANNDVRTMSTGYAYQLGTNKALTGQNDDTSDIDIWAWLGVSGLGGAVGLNQEPSSTDCNAVCRDYDFAFDAETDDAGTYGDGLVVLWDDVDNRCEYRAWDTTTDTWSGTGIFQACTIGASGIVNWFTAIQNPWTGDTYDAMILRGNDNNDVFAHQWDGEFDTAASGINHILNEITLSSDTTDQTYPYFDFSWGMRAVEYDVRLEIWNTLTDTVSTTIGTCLNIITRGDDIQCLISGVAQQTLGVNEEVRIKIAHSSAAGTVIISYDDADTTGDSRATIPIPEFEFIFISIIFFAIILYVRRKKKNEET